MGLSLVKPDERARREKICKSCSHRTEKRFPLPAIFGRESIVIICKMCGCPAGARLYFGCPEKHW